MELRAAIRDNDLLRVQQLLAARAEIEQRHLHSAAELGRAAILRELLDAMAPSYAKRTMATSALMCGVRGGHAECVALLLTHGADVCWHQDKALLWCKDAPVCRLLLAAGADVHARNDQALTTAVCNGDEQRVAVLLAAGADVHAQDDLALREALYDGFAGIVRLLLAAGANVHVLGDMALRLATLHK